MYNLLGEDIEGEDVEGDEATVGAELQELLGELMYGGDESTMGKRARRAIAARRPGWVRALARGAPGVPVPQDSKMLPLNFPVLVLAAGSTGGTNFVSPQKPFKGERAVALVIRSAGAGGVFPSGVIQIGMNPQGVTPAGTPYDTLAPTAFGVRFHMDPCAPGVIVTQTATTNIAVPVGEQVAILLTIFGHAIA
jgi:hypothetical protein